MITVYVPVCYYFERKNVLIFKTIFCLKQVFKNKQKHRNQQTIRYQFWFNWIKHGTVSYLLSCCRKSSKKKRVEKNDLLLTNKILTARNLVKKKMWEKLQQFLVHFSLKQVDPLVLPPFKAIDSTTSIGTCLVIYLQKNVIINNKHPEFGEVGWRWDC